ncbi:MAG TPA: hypothetical protein VK498_01975 [Ferruginibacter sp.]|nr:hypothetical protein [Ferruginibacter sp.]
MKKLLLYLTIFFTSIQFSSAQDDGKKEDRIQALYVAYITQELKLSTDEAQKFWPLHAQFDSEIKTLRTEMPELDRQQAALNIKKKYQESFVKILGAPRTNDFYRKDGEFRKKMIDRLRQMRQQNNFNQRPNMRRNLP